ncbi:hypothetical protein QFZ67_000250 [Streptomyces sp. V1I1]|nr:hypothetical protein [Streptomyces sp. V1I1]
MTLVRAQEFNASTVRMMMDADPALGPAWVDQGDLTDEQEERLGSTLLILHERMSELCDQYGLTMEDLNLDLGPLGTLLPPSD